MDIKFSIKKSSVSLAITVLFQLPIISPVLAGVDVTVSGNTYNISTVVGTYTSQAATLQSQIWWGNSTSAESFAAAVAASLGYPNDPLGPYFAYRTSSGTVDAHAAFRYLPGITTFTQFPESISRSYAIVNLVPASTNILSGATNFLSSLGGSLNPVLEGGTLTVDSASTTSSGFTIKSVGGTIDTNGLQSVFSGVIADAVGSSGKLTIVNTGTAGQGVVRLTADNTYTGGTEIQAGANLQIASSAALGTGTLALVGTATVSATLSTTADMIINNPITVAYDPTFNVAPSTTTTISSVIADGGVAGDVVVEGGGTLALTNVNTYTGPTTIASGSTLTLSGSGSIANSSSVTNNGTFNVRGASGNVALGGTLTQTSTGNLLMNISPVSNQKILVTGAASLAGGLALNASAGSYTTGKYTLITASGVTGTFGTFSSDLSSYTRLGYTLGYDANSVFLTFTPNVTDTQTSLSNSLASLQGLYNLQTSVINNGLSYDCSLFDTRGLCISTGGRYSNTNTPTGDTTGALVIGGYRVNDHVRVGLYLDQGISSSMPTGINLKKHNPLFGAFAVWQASQDGLGAQVKVAAGYNDADMTVTRAVVDTSEAGSGSTNLTSKAISAVGSYGVEMQGSWIASPYAGARYTNVKADGYTEATSSTVTAPLSYANLEQSEVSLLAGIRWFGKLTDRVALNGSVGVEHDVDNSHANYTATGITGLTPTVFNTDINKTRAVASVGTTVSIDKRQQLAFSVMYREEAFSNSSTTSAYGTYTIGF
jgi:autotransporter-associated beta strand protein